MTAANARDALRATALAVLADTVLWIVWFAGMLFYVPRLMRHFQDLRVQLPTGTQLVLAASRWLVHYPYLIPFFLLAGIALDGGVGYLLRTRAPARRLAWLWWGVMIALPVLAILACWMALGFPVGRPSDAPLPD
jgi:type II secretory pathway component PulF